VRHKHWLITVTAIVCITVLEAIALYKGIDGSLMATVIAALAGLGGYTLAQATKAKGGE
jgi:uncharacterized membrane protein YgaE (UPF0421/DUF939 family)